VFARCTEPFGAISRSNAAVAGLSKRQRLADHEGGDEDLRHGEPAGKGGDRQKQRRRASASWQSCTTRLRSNRSAAWPATKTKSAVGRNCTSPTCRAGRRCRDVVDLPADRNRGDLAGEARKASRQQEEQERPVPEQVAAPTGIVEDMGDGWAERDAESNGQARNTHCAAARRWHNRCRGFWGIHAGNCNRRLACWALLRSHGRSVKPPRGLVAANPVGLAVTVVTALVLLKLPPVARASAPSTMPSHDLAASRAGTSSCSVISAAARFHSTSRQRARISFWRFQALPIVLVMSVSDDGCLFYGACCADRARHGVAPGAHARRRRRGGTFDRGEYLSRHGRGAAVHPPLSGAAHAQRIIPGDDRWHGRHRRHRAGALRHFLAPLIPDAARHFVIASCWRPVGHPGQFDHGAGDFGQAYGGSLEDPGSLAIRHACLLHDGRHRQGHDAGLELLLNIIAMLLVLVALGLPRQRHSWLLPEIGGAKISLQRLLGLLMARCAG